MGRLRKVRGEGHAGQLGREVAALVAGRRQSLVAGLVILLVVPGAAAVRSASPVVTYLQVLSGGLVVASALLVAWVLVRRGLAGRR